MEGDVGISLKDVLDLGENLSRRVRHARPMGLPFREKKKSIYEEATYIKVERLRLVQTKRGGRYHQKTTGLYTNNGRERKRSPQERSSTERIKALIALSEVRNIGGKMCRDGREKEGGFPKGKRGSHN